MKLLISSMLLGLSAGTVQAQSANPALWCPPGATWRYEYSHTTTTQVRGTMTVRYARDTMVAGQPAQLLTRLLNVGPIWNGTISYYPPHYTTSVVTRVVGDRVEILVNNQFYTLYDFAAQPGASWLTPALYCPTTALARATVDSVGVTQIGGRSLRWLRVRMTAATGTLVLGGWSGRIYEQAGNLGSYLQSQTRVCTLVEVPSIGPLLSYAATGYPTLGPSSGQAGLTVLGAATARSTPGFAVFPNPSTGHVSLRLPANLSPQARLRVLNAMGQLVWQQKLPANQQIDLGTLPAGYYTLLLDQPGQPSLAGRLLRE